MTHWVPGAIRSFVCGAYVPQQLEKKKKKSVWGGGVVLLDNMF
jgi:hypothetical protein